MLVKRGFLVCFLTITRCEREVDKMLHNQLLNNFIGFVLSYLIY